MFSYAGRPFKTLLRSTNSPGILLETMSPPIVSFSQVVAEISSIDTR